jgi:hypothetical protein
VGPVEEEDELSGGRSGCGRSDGAQRGAGAASDFISVAGNTMC